jgi:type IV fimbrial biogenesis protein FimT
MSKVVKKSSGKSAVRRKTSAGLAQALHPGTKRNTLDYMATIRRRDPGAITMSAIRHRLKKHTASTEGRHMKQRGLSLIELILGLFLSGILANLAVPSLKGLLESQRRQGAAESLASGVRYARTEAIARNRTVVIHALDDDWSRGWRVILDLNGRGHLDDDNPVLLERQDSGQIPIVGNTPVRTQIRFSGLGEPLLSAGAFSAGTVHVCATDQQLSLYQIVLAASGRISLRSNKTEQALCRGYAGTQGLRAANEPAAPWAWRK